MRTVIIISRCLDERPDKVNFHFKGFYAGLEIKALQLCAPANMQWRRNAEYVMYVRVTQVADGVLHGEVLRGRLLDELTN